MARVQVSITIEKEILKQWKKYCDDNDINKSKRIERYMKKDLEKEKR